MKSVRPLLFLIPLIFNISVRAQQQSMSVWSYGVNPYYGAVLKYKQGMDQLEFSHLHGIELYVAKESDGSKYWHHLYNYPQWGIAASMINYGKPDELGEAYNLSTYLDVTSSKKKHKWRLNIGTGIVYSTMKYNLGSNIENKAISSDISYIMRGTIHKEFCLKEHLFFNVNVAFRHYSNGKLNMPNNGMNYPMVGIGLRYLPSSFTPLPAPIEQIEIDKKWHLDIRGSIAWRQVWEEDVMHKAYSVGAYVGKQISHYNTLLIGIDAFKYDDLSVARSNSIYREQQGIPTNERLDDDPHQLALALGTALLVSQVSVIVQLGVYLYKPQAYYPAIYQRYGVKYGFHQHFFGQFSLNPDYAIGKNI